MLNTFVISVVTPAIRDSDVKCMPVMDTAWTTETALWTWKGTLPVSVPVITKDCDAKLI